MTERAYCRVYYTLRDEPWYWDDRKLARWLREQLDELGKRVRSRVRLPDDQWHPILVEFGFRCAYCRSETKLEQEHRMPVSRGGEMTPDNIVPACRSCNARKGSRHPDDWPLA